MQPKSLLVHSSGKSWDHEYCWLDVGPSREPTITSEGKSIFSRLGLAIDRPAFAVFRYGGETTLNFALAGLASSNQPNRDGRILNAVIYRELNEPEARALAHAAVNRWAEIESAVDKAIVFDNEAQAGFHVNLAAMAEVVSRSDFGDPPDIEQISAASLSPRTTGKDLANWFLQAELGQGFGSVVCRKAGSEWEFGLQATTPKLKPADEEPSAKPTPQGSPPSPNVPPKEPRGADTLAGPTQKAVEHKYGIKKQHIAGAFLVGAGAFLVGFLIGIQVAKLTAPRNQKKKVLLTVEFPDTISVRGVSVGGVPAKLSSDGLRWELPLDLNTKEAAGVRVVVEGNPTP